MGKYFPDAAGQRPDEVVCNLGFGLGFNHLFLHPNPFVFVDDRAGVRYVSQYLICYQRQPSYPFGGYLFPLRILLLLLLLHPRIMCWSCRRGQIQIKEMVAIHVIHITEGVEFWRQPVCKNKSRSF